MVMANFRGYASIGHHHGKVASKLHIVCSTRQTWKDPSVVRSHHATYCLHLLAARQTVAQALMHLSSRSASSSLKVASGPHSPLHRTRATHSLQNSLHPMSTICAYLISGLRLSARRGCMTTYGSCRVQSCPPSTVSTSLVNHTVSLYRAMFACSVLSLIRPGTRSPDQ